MTSSYRSFYPEIEPYNQGMLPVNWGHTIYFEESGNSKGKPVIYVHGGPGGGSAPNMRRVFNPDKYRIILFDQRGCGKSTPYASLENNTTWDLVADMEQLRQHLHINKWQVCGGSWGSTLSLAYAQTHADKVTELILRGVFTLRKSELDWYYQGGAAHIFPDKWAKFVAPIDISERENLIDAYYKLLTSTNKHTQLTAAQAWSTWEGSTINLLQRPQQISHFASAQFAIAFARIECHYFINKGFFDYDGWLIDHANRISHLPVTIIQGRYDICTPMTTAWDLHQALPQAVFNVVPDAGHAFDEPGITDQIIRTTDRLVT